MKKAIEKAIRNGFKFQLEKDFSVKSFKYDDTIIKAGEEHFRFTYREKGIPYRGGGIIQFFRLIFSTNFIDTLTDEDDTCSLLLTYPSFKLEHKCPDGRPIDDCMNCGNVIDAADYHRAIMANLKDVEALKEYVRKLV